MKNLWLRFGCFLTGYNYSLLRQCSEAAKKTVKRYTAAMIIIMTIWAIVAYGFSTRYLKLEVPGGIIAGVIAVIIIVQVERQIILTVRANNWVKFFRVLLAVVMAAIGAIITDQLIFGDDIEREKDFLVQTEIDSLVDFGSQSLDIEIKRLEARKARNDSAKTELLNDLSLNPFISQPTTKRIYVPQQVQEYDTVQKKMVLVTKQIPKYEKTVASVPNPKGDQLSFIEKRDSVLSGRITDLSDSLLVLRKTVTHKVESRQGLLMELEAMRNILSKRSEALVVWVMWMILLLVLELLVLVTKASNKEDDYDALILHQMDVRKESLSKLK